MSSKIAKWKAQLGLDDSEFNSKLSAAVGKSKKFGQSVDVNIDAPVKRAAIAAGVAAGAIAGMYTQAAIAGDEAAKTADKLGIATNKLMGLRHAAELTGVSSNNLDMGLQRMTRRVAQAASGSGEAVKALKELGISAQELNRLSPDQQFSKIADAMNQVDNQADKVRLTFALFDSEGVGLVNTMALGSAGLRDTVTEAERLGITLNRVEAAKLEAANDAMHRGKQAAKGFSNVVAVELAPYVEAVGNHFYNAALESGGFGDIVASVSDKAVKAVGFVADGIKGMQLGWQFVKLGAIEAVQSGLMQIQRIDSGITSFLNKIPGVNAQVSEGLQLHIKALGFAAQDARKDLDDFTRDLAAKGLPSELIAKTADQIKRRAQEAAEAVASSKKQIDTAAGSPVVSPVAAKTKNDNKALEQARAANDALYQEHLRHNGRVVDLENHRFIKQLQKIDGQLLAARAKGESEKALIAELNEQKEQLERNHGERLLKIKEDEEKTKKKIEAATNKQRAQSLLGTFQALGQHSKKAFKVWKAGAKAQALVDTYAAAIGAYKALAGIPIVGPALGAAAALAAARVGRANIRAINATQFGGGAAGVAAPAATSGPSLTTAANDPVGPSNFNVQKAQSEQSKKIVNINFPNGSILSPDTLPIMGELFRQAVEADEIQYVGTV